MHILTTTSASLDDLVEPVDLRQTPADIVALSFTDSDLAGLAAAWKADAATPAVDAAGRAARPAPSDVRRSLDRQRRPRTRKSSWCAFSAATTGGATAATDLPRIAREKGIKLALLPGECRDEDLRLIECSTLPRAELDALLGYFREGGPENMRGAGAAAGGARRRRGGGDGAGCRCRRRGFMSRDKALSSVTPSLPLEGRVRPQAGGGVAWERCDEGTSSTAATTPSRPFAGHPPLKGEGRDAPVIPILFYRSMLLAADVAPIDALFEALRERGMAPVPIFVSSLKDPASLAFVETALADLAPSAIITATAFATGAEPGVETLFDRAGVPVFQVIVATTRREAWAGKPARPRARRPRHACRHARTRRPHPCRRHRLQGRDRGRCRTGLQGLRQPPGAGPRGAGRRPHRRLHPPAAHAARGAEARRS